MKKFIVFLIVVYAVICCSAIAVSAMFTAKPTSRTATSSQTEIADVTPSSSDTTPDMTGRASRGLEEESKYALSDEDDATGTDVSAEPELISEDTSASSDAEAANEQTSDVATEQPAEDDTAEIVVTPPEETEGDTTLNAEESDSPEDADTSETAGPDYSDGTYTFMTIHESGTLRVRKTPDSDGKGIAYLYPGAVGLVLGREGDFTKIQYKEKVGYVPNEFVALYRRED